MQYRVLQLISVIFIIVNFSLFSNFLITNKLDVLVFKRKGDNANMKVKDFKVI